jgi:hypothetical protein
MPCWSAFRQLAEFPDEAASATANSAPVPDSDFVSFIANAPFSSDWFS